MRILDMGDLILPAFQHYMWEGRFCLGSHQCRRPYVEFTNTAIALASSRARYWHPTVPRISIVCASS